MNNIQYPLEGSSGWGDAVNSNFHAFEDGIDDLNSNKTEILSTIGDEVMGTTATTLKGAIAEVKGIANSNTTQLNDKANITSILNNCSTTEEGFILDARQGKMLFDLITELQNQCTVKSASGKDLNNYKTTCKLFTNGATNIPNENTGTYWLIDVMSNSNVTIQKASCVNGSSTYIGKTYTRYYNGTTWSEWTQL